MLPGVTVTSANAAARSRRSDVSLGHRLEHPDRAAEAAAPFHRRFPVWFPVAVFALSRLVVVVIAVVTSRGQIALPVGIEGIRIAYPTDPDPGYFGVMSNWDAQWYRIIAEDGYPAVLPRTAGGEIDMNPWAFFPVFPLLVGGLMRVTGLPFVVVGPLLSTLIGFVAVFLLFKLADRVAGRFTAIVAVVATSFYIASPVFSAAYTESLALLVVVGILLLLRARRYWWVAALLVVLALSRNVVIAMAPVVICHAVVRWRQHDEGPRPWVLRVGLLALAGFAGALTFLWPTIISAATGVADAYNLTMQAWNIETRLKLDLWWRLLDDYGGATAQVLGVLGVAAFAWFMLSPASWRWGPEVWGWAGAYPAYILLVSSPTPSRVRYALLAFPMTFIIAWFLQLRWVRRFRWPLLGLVVLVGTALMWWWTKHYLVIENLTDDLYP